MAENFLQIIPQDEISKIEKNGRKLIEDKLLNHPEPKMQLIIDAMRLKRIVGKSFTEFLLYVIKLFIKAINDGTITLRNSVRDSTIRELDNTSQLLLYVRKDFEDNMENETPPDASIDMVVRCAEKVTDVIKSLQKKHWLRWLRSAKNISALVPIFERLTEVVKMLMVKCSESELFIKILGDVQDLKDSLHDIERRLMVSQGIGLSVSVLIGIGSVVSVIVGVILSFTPAGVPLVTVGGVGIVASVVTAGATYVVTKRSDHAKTKGDRKGDKFVKNDTTTLPQL